MTLARPVLDSLGQFIDDRLVRQDREGIVVMDLAGLADAAHR